MPRVWITRSQPFAAQTAHDLCMRGYDAFAAPLLTIALRAAPPLPADKDHLVFTSRHGVRALAGQTSKRHWPAICVGDGSRQAAREAGFLNAHSASGTALDITAWIQANWPQSTPVTHISGQHQRGDIFETLCGAGYHKARRIVFYDSLAVSSDPRPTPRPDDYVLLYSPRGAASLARLNLDMRQMHVISLSAAIDAVMEGKNCKVRYIAAKPNEASLFAHLPPCKMI